MKLIDLRIVHLSQESASLLNTLSVTMDCLMLPILSRNTTRMEPSSHRENLLTDGLSNSTLKSMKEHLESNFLDSNQFGVTTRSSTPTTKIILSFTAASLQVGVSSTKSITGSSQESH